MHLSAFLPPPFLLCAKHHLRGYYSNPPGQPTLPFVVTCRDLTHRTKLTGPCLFIALLWDNHKQKCSRICFTHWHPLLNRVVFGLRTSFYQLNSSEALADGFCKNVSYQSWCNMRFEGACKEKITAYLHIHPLKSSVIESTLYKGPSHLDIVVVMEIWFNKQHGSRRRYLCLSMNHCWVHLFHTHINTQSE